MVSVGDVEGERGDGAEPAHAEAGTVFHAHAFEVACGVADIVESTKAIAAQRYKAVNMAGAAVVAAGLGLKLGCAAGAEAEAAVTADAA